MLEEDLVLVYVPLQQLNPLAKLLLPICRQHGYDDVLPEVPHGTYDACFTLIRTSGSKQQALPAMLLSSYTSSSAKCIADSIGIACKCHGLFPPHPKCSNALKAS
jgi:hypothetical protein